MGTVSRDRIKKLNIWQILEALRRKYLLILISMVACGLVVFLVTMFAVPHYYECAAYFSLGTPVFKAGRTPTTNERHMFEEKTENCDQLLRTDAAIAEMLAYANEDTDQDKLMEMIYAEPDLKTALIRVAVRGEDPKEVGRLAEKIGRLLPKLAQEDPVYRKSVEEEPKKPVTPKVLRDTLSAMVFGISAGVSFVILKQLFPAGIKGNTPGRYQKTEDKPQNKKRRTGAFEADR